MYHAPECSIIVIPPNAIVQGSSGMYTSWTQTSHVLDGMASITFFNKKDETRSVDIVNMSIRNDLWYTQQRYTRLLSNANPIEIFYLYSEDDYDVDSGDSFFVGKLSAEATYELWYQRTTHSGQNVMKSLFRCVDGVPKKLAKCRHGLYQCECCQPAESTKTTGNASGDVKVMAPCESFQIDFGFIKAVDTESNENTNNLIKLGWI